MNMATMTSQHILAHYTKTNDESALVTLLERHYHKVVKFVLSRYFTDLTVAEHVADETFTRMRNAKYDTTKSFSNWLRVLAGHVALDYSRTLNLKHSLPHRDAARLLGVTRHEYRQLIA